MLGYWFQPNGKGLIQNDMMAIPKSAEHPVLAHHFLNFLLDPKNALLNFNGIGYQQPLNQLHHRLVHHQGSRSQEPRRPRS